eukprot:jgi/Botrbrau1/11937/Bobra.341_1s0004.1
MTTHRSRRMDGLEWRKGKPVKETVRGLRLGQVDREYHHNSRRELRSKETWTLGEASLSM